MPPDAAPPGRLALTAIVAQGWLIGGGGGTAAGLAVPVAVPGVGAGGLGGGLALTGFGAFVLIGTFSGLVLSAPFALLGIGISAAFPRQVVRWRTPLCLALVALVTVLAAPVFLQEGASSTGRVVPCLMVWDAVLAAAWVHRRIRSIARAGNPSALAAVFR